MPSSKVPTKCPYCNSDVFMKKHNQASCYKQDDHEFWYFVSDRTGNISSYIEINNYIIDPVGIRYCPSTETHHPLLLKFNKIIKLESAINIFKRFIAMKAFS